MKSPWIIGIVIAAHVGGAALCLLVPGCGTLDQPETVPTAGSTVIMPPKQIVDVPPPPVTSITPPTVTTWPETTSYVVQKGDSMSVIAKRFGLTVTEIASVNGIADYNKIFVGQKLALPGKIDANAAPRPATAAKTVAPLSGNEYEVQKGDSLSVIAARFGIKTKDLKQANGLTSDKILVGQKLTIPGKAAAPTQAARPVTSAQPAAMVTPPAKPAVSLDAEPMTTPSVRVNPEEAVTAPAITEDGIFKTHVVEEDEDLYSIAMLWQVSPAKIKTVNGLESDEVKPGQKLKIPLSD